MYDMFWCTRIWLKDGLHYKERSNVACTKRWTPKIRWKGLWANDAPNQIEHIRLSLRNRDNKIFLRQSDSVFCLSCSYVENCSHSKVVSMWYDTWIVLFLSSHLMWTWTQIRVIHMWNSVQSNVFLPFCQNIWQSIFTIGKNILRR